MSVDSIIGGGYGSGTNNLVTRGFAAYSGLPDPLTAGLTYATYKGGGAGDWLGAGASPAIVVGDIFSIGVTSPGGYQPVLNPDGTVTFLVGGDPSRQSAQYNVFRPAFNSSDVNALVWVNEIGPTWGSSLFLLLPAQVEITPIDVTDPLYAFSIEGDGMVVTLISGSLPPGLSLDPTGVISGTPTAVGVFTFILNATDSTGTARPSSTMLITVASPGVVPVIPVGPTLLAPPPDTAGAQIDEQIAVLQAFVNTNANPLIAYQMQQQLNQWQVEAVVHYMATGWANAGAILAVFQPPLWDVPGQALARRVAFLQNLVNNPPAMPPGNASGYGSDGWTTIAASYAQKLYAAQTALVNRLMDLPGGTTAATILSTMTGAQTAPGGIPYAYKFSSVGFTDEDIED